LNRIARVTAALLVSAGISLSAERIPAATAQEHAPALLLVPYYTTVGDVWSSKRISAYKIDASTGDLKLVAGSPFASGSDPTAAAATPDGRFAYVVNHESADISAYKVDARTGALARVPGSPFAVSDFSSDPTGIVVDPLGKHLYAVSNAGVSAFAIAANGALRRVPGSPFSAEESGGGFGTTSIAIDPANKFAYVLNDSRHTLSAYAIDESGALKLAGAPLHITGSGSLTLDSKGRFLYLSGGTNCCVYVYAIDAANGALTPSTTFRLPKFEAGLDELRGFALDPAGKFAYAVVAKYATNGSRIFTYRVDAGGSLKPFNSRSNGVDAGSDPTTLTIDRAARFAYALNRAAPKAAIKIYGFRLNADGSLAPLAQSPVSAASVTNDPIASWFDAARCTAFDNVQDSGKHAPPVAKRDSDLNIGALAAGYFYDAKRGYALHYPYGDAGGTIALIMAGQPPAGVTRRDLGKLRTSAGIAIGSSAQSVVHALGKPKIVDACNEQAYFYITPGEGMPLLLQFTIRNGIVTGIAEERGG
jgi:6-phosphogluconolactonase (cycloisomerase 2 family)